MRFPLNFVIGSVMIIFVLSAAIISLFWTPHSYNELNISMKFSEPSMLYWLGTDQLGRDVVSQLMVAAQNSVQVALVAVLFGGAIGTLIIFIYYSNSLREDIIMRIADLGFAFPALLFAIMLAASLGPSLNNAILAIAFINIPIFARVSRGSANQIWQREYVAAAKASGLTKLSISINHILPNILAPIIVQATIEFAVAILAEAALSYLGLGAQPPQPSWGRMLSEAQTLMYLAPELAIYPGVCIIIAVIGFGLLGDGLRDITDPRLQGSR